MNKTEQFLNSIGELFSREIPARVMDRARLSLLDYLAVTFAGAASVREKLSRYLQAAEPEAGEYPVIGCGLSLNLKEAVFLNGLLAHYLDLDDGSNRGIIHLGSPVFSALLPLAQKHGASWQEFLEAAVLGYEAAYTLAVSIQPGHKERGWHATGTCGTLGIALALSRLLKLTAEETRHAFAAASVSAGGVLNVLDEGSELKPYNVAKSALLGLTAVQMARAGFKGPLDPLGGERGFLSTMTGDRYIPLLPPLSAGLYAVEKTYTKPYAACRYCHPAIDAALRILKEDGLDPEDIVAVEVLTYRLAVYQHDHTDIPGPASAKMSIPYSVAAALLHGRAGMESYSERAVGDPRVLALTRKVQVKDDQEMTDAFPKETRARVKLTLSGGQSLEREVREPKGEPSTPLTKEEFEARFLDLMAFGGRAESQARTLYRSVQEGEGSMEDFFSLLKEGSKE